MNNGGFANAPMNNNTPQDHSGTVEQFLTTLMESLDQPGTAQPSSILPQLHQQPRIIINGQPFGSKEQFQQLWASLPLTNHQITSCDVHFVPSSSQPQGMGPGQFVVLAHLKARFDESGKNKLGDTALFNSTTASSARSIWSHWFGVSLSCVIDSTVVDNFNTECISTWDYRFTESPSSSIFQIN